MTLPGFDDRLKQHLEKVAPPADPSGAFDRILEKKIRRRLMRRFQAAGLAVAVVAATVGGTFVLVRAFESRNDHRLGGTAGPVRNGLIAYASTKNGNYDIWTARPDGTRATNITAESLANETDPAWSPDGTKIAFVSDRGGNPDIYIMSADGANVTRLTNDPSGQYGPAWSPDGSRIAYASGTGGGCVSQYPLDCSSADVFVMNADGEDLGLERGERLTSGDELDRHPTWAPDGSRIAFARVAVDAYYPPGATIPPVNGIYLMEPNGGSVRRLTEPPDTAWLDGIQGVDDWPEWSPDGMKIVFARGVNIYVMNADGSGLRKLTDSQNRSPSARPSWSPDGTKIVFERIAPGELFFQIHTMNADGSDLRATGITPTDLEVAGSDWQPIPAAASTSPTPTTDPSPTPTPFPAECDASQVSGNFDGDGEPDTATVAKTDCLIDPGDQGDRFSTEYSLQVRWPPSEGIAPLPDCKTACRAIAATDLNRDGIDEFILQVDEGRTTNVFQIYELPATEAFGRPSDVAPPGSPEFPAGEAARFSLGGSDEHYVALGCDLIEHQVIVQIAELNAERTRFNVHEILLRFDPMEAPPFGRFTVVSERDFTESHEEGVGPGDQFEPGDPCWMEQF